MTHTTQLDLHREGIVHPCPICADVVFDGPGWMPCASCRELFEHRAISASETRSSWWDVLRRMERPEIVCLCGSTRFGEAFAMQNYRLTLLGKIVLTVQPQPHDSRVPYGRQIAGRDQDQERLDELDKRKIDLADSIMVLNVGGYIGEREQSQIRYATRHRKPVKYLEPTKHSDDGKD